MTHVHKPAVGTGAYPATVALHIEADGLAAELVATAEELLRVALIAKLSVDLDDPHLARRAARDASTASARLLTLRWPPPAADETSAYSDERPLSLERILHRVCPMPLGASQIEQQAKRLHVALPAHDWPSLDDEQEPPADWTEAIGQ